MSDSNDKRRNPFARLRERLSRSRETLQAGLSGVFKRQERISPENAEQLEEILSTEGVDMIQWGPSDYSMSIGRPGERTAPEVKAVERKVFETALRMGVKPRAEIASVDQAKYYLDMGVRHFSLGTDLSILFNWWKTNGDQLRNVIAGA